MMLLSGVYFTLDSAPRWLQHAVTALPLSPYLKALRAVFNDGSVMNSLICERYFLSGTKP